MPMCPISSLSPMPPPTTPRNYMTRDSWRRFTSAADATGRSCRPQAIKPPRARRASGGLRIAPTHPAAAAGPVVHRLPLVLGDLQHEGSRPDLSTGVHCAHVIVPLPRYLPDDESPPERGEQSVRSPQVDVESHFEPGTFYIGEQLVRIVRAPHVRAGVGFPTVGRPQPDNVLADEREPHGSGLFHLDQVCLPTDHLAAAQSDPAQFGVTVPKFRAPRVDVGNRSLKPLRQSEAHKVRSIFSGTRKPRRETAGEFPDVHGAGGRMRPSCI